ncbi:MAG: hypothetical protein Q9N02_11290, partial [Ghiorsea sp.]|nr:hypothetical protein [Ghiorsea sp.]
KNSETSVQLQHMNIAIHEFLVPTVLGGNAYGMIIGINFSKALCIPTQEHGNEGKTRLHSCVLTKVLDYALFFLSIGCPVLKGKPTFPRLYAFPRRSMGTRDRLTLMLWTPINLSRFVIYGFPSARE